MSNELRKALEAKSDRLNADDLMAGNRTIKITDVRIVLSAADGNIIIHFEGDNNKPWKPSKGMGRALAAMWGDDERQWVGRSVELFREASVEYGGKEVGGIQICGASHIDRDMLICMTKKRGQKVNIKVRKLDTAHGVDKADTVKRLEFSAMLGTDSLVKFWKSLPASHREVFGNKCPEDLKRIAAAADATKKQPEPEPQQAEPEPVAAEQTTTTTTDEDIF